MIFKKLFSKKMQFQKLTGRVLDSSSHLSLRDSHFAKIRYRYMLSSVRGRSVLAQGWIKRFIVSTLDLSVFPLVDRDLNHHNSMHAFKNLNKQQQ